MTLVARRLRRVAGNRSLFRTDFSEYSVGVAPSDWTARGIAATWTVVAAGDISANCLRKSSGGSNGNRILTWDILDSIGAADTEILLRIRSNNTGNTGFYIGGAIRHANTYTHYMGGLTNETGRSIGIGESANTDNWAALAEFNNLWAANTWYWVRFRAVGSSLDAKMWSGLIGDEPGSWQVSTSDATISAAGRTGIICRRPDQLDCGYFSAAFGGDIAPPPA